MNHQKINKFPLSVPLLMAYFALHLSCESNQSKSKPEDHRSGVRNDAALNAGDPAAKPSDPAAKPSDPAAKPSDPAARPSDPVLTSSDLAGLDKTQWEKPCRVTLTLQTDERDYIYYAKETINFSNPVANGNKLTFKFQTRPAMFGLDSNCSKPLSQEESLYLKEQIGVKEFELIMNAGDINIEFLPIKLLPNVYETDVWSPISSNKAYLSMRLEKDSLTFSETCAESIDTEIEECPVVIGDSPANRGTKFGTDTYKRKI